MAISTPWMGKGKSTPWYSKVLVLGHSGVCFVGVHFDCIFVAIFNMLRISRVVFLSCLGVLDL